RSTNPRVHAMPNVFDLTGRVAAITGGAGLLGEQHARAIARAGGIPILLDVSEQTPQKAEQLATELGVSAWGRRTDITQARDLEECLKEILARFGRIDILINNAANNPTVENREDANFLRFENFPLRQWAADIDVGLTGAFLCSKTLGSEMAKRGRGVIVNVASDLALIGPDQRIYRRADLSDHPQPVEPVTYSVGESAPIPL